MKDEVMYKVKSIQDAINNVSVQGKQNVTLMAGIMVIIDEVYATLSQCAFDKIVKDEKAED